MMLRRTSLKFSSISGTIEKDERSKLIVLYHNLLDFISCLPKASNIVDGYFKLAVSPTEQYTLNS
jgi:hypothetical protein